MENVVAARRLRKSYSNFNENKEKNEKYGVEDIFKNLNIENKIKKRDDKCNTNFSNEEYFVKNESRFHIKYKTKLLIKTFIASAMLFTVFLIKTTMYSNIKDNKIISFFVNSYKKEYNKRAILENIEEFSKIAYSNLNYAIPSKFATGISTFYLESIKSKILEKDLKETVYAVFSNNDNKSNNVIIYENNVNENEVNINENKVNQEEKKEEEKNEEVNQEEVIGMGGGNPVTNFEQELKIEESISAISLMDMDVEEIKEKKIEWVSPTYGTITSKYGVREEIFLDVNPYHTGIDIANKLGTNINSATSGKVIKIDQNNKYYGKMIDIETDGVVFRYAHLNEILIKEGDDVLKNSLIGYMGTTGYSTGPHLHFEIRINNRSIDPQLLGFYI